METKIKRFILTGVLLVLGTIAYSQGLTCGTATPFCSNDPSVSFPAGVASGNYSNNLGCLVNTPNPAWYYMQVNNPGRINIRMWTSPARDLDFAVWGPFSASNINELMNMNVCSSLDSNCGVVCGHNCQSHASSNGANPTNLGGYPCGNLVDCSYSADPIEYVHIPNTLPGQWYVLLITNYSNQQCQISFNSDVTSTGATNCGVLVPSEAYGDIVCEGDTAKLSPASLHPGYTYKWVGPNGFVQTSTNPDVIFPNVGLNRAGTYTLTFYNADTISEPANCELVVYPKPIITFLGDTVYPGQTATVPATGGTTYQWSNGFVGNPLVTVPVASTLYRLTVTTINGCKDSSSVIVKVTNAPQVIKNPDVINICQGLSVSASISYYLSLPSCSNFSQYRTRAGTTWTSWANYVSNAPILTDSVNEVQIRAYQLSCNNGGLIINSDTTLVTWIAHPQITRASFIRNPIQDGICLTVPLSVSADTLPGVPYTIEYQYQPPTQTSWTNGNIFTPDQMGLGWIRARATSQGYGCISTEWEWYSWLIQPQPEITGLTDQEVCRGSTISFLADVVDGYGSNSFVWQRSMNGCDGNWNTLNTPDSAAYTSAPTNQTGFRYYRAIVTQSGFNCKDTSNCVVVNVHPFPQLTINSDTLICANDSLIISANVNGGAGTNTITWQIRTSLTDPWTDYTQTTTPFLWMTDANQSFYIRGFLNQSAPGCNDLSNTIFVRVRQAAQITQQPQDVQACVDLPISISVSATGEAPIQYQWYGPNGIISGQTTSTFQISMVALSDTGAYYCVVSNICGTQTSLSAMLSIGDTYVAPTAITGIVNRCSGAGWNMYTANPVNETSSHWAIQPPTAGTIDDNGLVTWNPTFVGTSTIYFISTGCGITDTLSLDVQNLLPVGNLSVIYGDSVRCQGFGFSQYTTFADNAISYVWQVLNAGGSTIDFATGMVIWDPNFNGTAIISVYAIGCNGTSNTITKEVKINDFTPIHSLGGAEICLGEPSTFTAVVDTVTALEYQWFGPNGILPGQNDSVLFIPITTIADSGMYYCRVTTYCGYSFTPFDTLIIHTPPTVSFVALPNCMSESVAFTNNSTSSDMPMTAHWNFGDGSVSTEFHANHAYNLNGTYNVQLIVQSSFGCMDSTTMDIVIYEKPFFTLNSINVSCFGLSDASITIDVTGGLFPYSYLLNNGTPQDTNYFGNLAAGVYYVTVFDSNLCNYTDSVIITQPELLMSSYLFSNVLCFLDSTGTITPSVNGGTPPYNFLWSNGSTDSIVHVPTGTYDVIITDANGCTVTHAGIYISQPNPIVIDSIVVQRSCELVKDGLIAVYPTGGYGSYHYSWSNLAISDSIMNLNSGIYTVTITDDNNCPYIQTFEILPNNEQCWEIWTSFSPNSDGVNDVWNIRFANLYPNMVVAIYNRWGSKVYESVGEYKPWDGKGPNGKLVPPSTYYFVVDLRDDVTKRITGNVTVIY